MISTKHLKNLFYIQENDQWKLLDQQCTQMNAKNQRKYRYNTCIIQKTLSLNKKYSIM